MAEHSDANGTISKIVLNLEALNGDDGKPKPIASTVQTISGLAWQLKIRKVLKPAKLKLYISCNKAAKDHLWLCKANIKLQTAYLDGTGQQSHSYSPCFFLTFNTCSFSLSEAHCKAIFEQLKTSPVEFKLDIRVSHYVQTNLPALNTSLVVNMGEGKSETLLINKHVLAGMSTYFSNLFFGDWNDKKMEQDGDKFQLNETDDFDIQAFKWMLYGAMTMGWVVQESNIWNSYESIRIIKLGVKFDMVLMVHYCEKSLVNTAKMTTMELLELADQYSLVQLKEHCLNEMSVLDFVENFGIHSRLSKTTQKELQAKMSGKAKEVRASARDLKTHIRHSRAMLNPFNKMAKAMWGEKASTVKAVEVVDLVGSYDYEVDEPDYYDGDYDGDDY